MQLYNNTPRKNEQLQKKSPFMQCLKRKSIKKKRHILQNRHYQISAYIELEKRNCNRNKNNDEKL